MTATQTSDARDVRNEAIAFAGLGLGAMSLLAGIFAVGLSNRAANEARDALSEARSAPPAATASAPEAVTLDEFSIAPGELVVPAGTVLTVDNAGTVTHNLTVDDVASPMIEAGDSTELDLSDLPPGTYEMRCDVPGHAAAGMKGTITIE
jgi:plastocyanin